MRWKYGPFQLQLFESSRISVIPASLFYFWFGCKGPVVQQGMECTENEVVQKSRTTGQCMAGYVANRPGNGLITPANDLMETGDQESVVFTRPGMKEMFRKIALCAMLVLILAPASVMAAGQQGQAQGIGNEAGSSLNVQHQIATETTAQEKFQNGPGEGKGTMFRNGDIQMLQNRSCDQNCDQDQDMVRNMTRDQIHLGSDSSSAGENRGTGLNGGKALQKQDGSAESLQNQVGLTEENGPGILAGFAEQLHARFRYIGGIFQALLTNSDAAPSAST